MRAVNSALLVLVCWLPAACAVEPQTFYGKSVGDWNSVLRDESSTNEKRRQAIWTLGCFRSEAKGAEHDLIRTLSQNGLQGSGVDALVGMGLSPELTVPILIQRFVKQGCVHLTGAGAIGWDPYVGDALIRVGEPAVPALIDVLNGPNWEMRVCAAEVLSRIGPPARGAVASLIQAVGIPDPRHERTTLVRHAIRALGRIGPDAKVAIPTLNRLLEKHDIDEFDIVMALTDVGAPPCRRLVNELLRDGDSYAASQLAWLGPKARETVPALRAVLADRRPQTRFSAAIAIAFIDPSAPEALPVLIEALKHLEDREIDVSHAPRALARLGPDAKAALPTLTGLVTKGWDDPAVFKALVEIDPEGKECIPALVSALNQKDYHVVDLAAKCLGLLGARAKEAVPALTEVITRDFDEDGGITESQPQVSAAKALQRIGAPAISAIPRLAVALKYRRRVRSPVELADAAREELDCSAAAAAADVLGSFGARATAAVPYLIEAAKTTEKDDENWAVRKAAILALGRIGPDANVAIPVIRDVMKQLGRGLQSRPEVLIALYQLDPAGKELAESWLQNQVVPRHQGTDYSLKTRAILLGAMGRTSLETDWITRRYLERMDSMFGSIDPREEESIELIEDWLETLGSFGTAGRLAIPRLNELRKHPNPWVRMWATEALERITARPWPAGKADPNH
jgi:HEAT repeat protein